MNLSEAVAPWAVVRASTGDLDLHVPYDIQGSRVALWIREPLATIRALIALDGRAEAILLLSYALSAETVAELAAAAGCTKILSDWDDIFDQTLPSRPRSRQVETQWLMTTSGTTGLPKIVPHTLASLARSVRRGDPASPPVWGLIYDATRFAGMQVVLQALIGGGTLLTSSPDTPLPDRVRALAQDGCTHLSATPTYWRRILMTPEHRSLRLQQVTLGGEIADQATLNALRAAFPDARLTHIYASTEAGVGFSVKDEREGFPAEYLGEGLEIRDGLLWLCPPGGAFVCSGDRVELDGDRVRFLGRDNGMMNIGGVKVFPETVENVLLSLPEVVMAKVSARRNPMTGAIVMAEIQLASGADENVARARVMEVSRARLVREAVPAKIRFVSGFETNAAGKIMRTGG